MDNVGRTGRGRATTAVAAALSLVALAGGAVVVRNVLETGCPVPSVVGRPLGTARSALTAASIPADLVSVRRVADQAGEGTVISQQSTTCSKPIRLEVSDGGPVIAAREVPEPFRTLLGGPEADAPVRLVATAQGDAYKTDRILTGDCAATRAAAGELSDDDFATRCRPALDRRLLQTLLGTTDRWWGEPPSGARGAESGVADNYMGTAWGARIAIDGWRLQVDLTISASREAGVPGPRRSASAGGEASGGDTAGGDTVARGSELAAMTVSKADGNAAVDILLVATQQPPLTAEPATLTQLRQLATDLLAVANQP